MFSTPLGQPRGDLQYDREPLYAGFNSLQQWAYEQSRTALGQLAAVSLVGMKRPQIGRATEAAPPD